ncbi:nuclear matrix constituent protein 1-like [Daucus carota subsp. sativus]|uniref:Nuclear matrix constituent protein 1-like protein n=1 Tax=Daucus carota subsp. sativus TaxID=79200 RepID=A0A175YFT5_DAUCS|nr:PREDICTED: protein CROWDED NUCLEI 2-like [Daucus carota subsp. sativus]
MFTPQKSNTNRSNLIPTTTMSHTNPRSTNKAKSVVFVDDPAPPRALLGGDYVAVERGEEEDWRRFREAGLLDEAAMEQRDRDAVVEKVAKLERELFDYQYNMGLLLMEKTEWTLKYEEMRRAQVELKEVLEQEQTTHLILLSESEKREENLRKALDMEKKCITDLEKALRDSGADNAQTKQSSEAKMVKANALLSGFKEKSMDVETKLHVADAKLEEVYKTSLELERKLQEVETRDSLLQRERMSFIAEREAHEATFSIQKKDLQEWEKKLQEAEERLCEIRRTTSVREVKVNEMEMALNLKKQELNKAQKENDLSTSVLKKEADDINHRLANLTAQEHKAETLRNELEMRDKELLALAEKLTARESVEIQTLLDEQQAVLDAKMQEFEVDMDGKRKSLDEEMRSKLDAVQYKKDEITHIEEKLNRLELSLENKSERIKEKEKDLESKLRTLKDKENLLKSDEKRLDLEKKHMLVDKDTLQTLKDEIEKTRADISQQQSKIQEEIVKLKISEDERAEYIRLRSELKEEIEKCRFEKELLLKAHKNLKEDRKSFEEKWEALDERSNALSREIKLIGEEKEKFEKFRLSMEEKIKNDRLATEDYIRRELETLETEKETFATITRQEQSLISEKAELEYSQMLHEFELRRKDLEVDIQKKRDELESHMSEREREFEEEREKEHNNISRLKEVAQKDMEELRSEKHRIEKDRQEIALKKKELKEHQLEMHKDIDELEVLNKKVKIQREQFIKERDRFLLFVDTLKSCNYCGGCTREYELSDLQLLEKEIDNSPIVELGPGVSYESQDRINLRSSNSGGHISWLQKCTSKIFKYSPGKAAQDSEFQSDMLATVEEDERPSDGHLETRGLNIANDGPEPSFGIANESCEIHLLASNDNKRDADQRHEICTDELSNIDSKAPVAPEDSQQSELSSGRRRPGKKTRGGSVAVGTTKRKRQAQPSRVMKSAVTADHSEEHSESVSEVGRRKRQQSVTSSVQTPGEKRYNLRRNKIVGTSGSALASVDVLKVESEVDVNKTETVQDYALASSQLIASEKDNPTGPLEDMTCRSLEIYDLSTEGDVELKTSKSRDKSIDPAIMGNIEFNEEVNSTIPECSIENGRGSTLHEDRDNEVEVEVLNEDEDLDIDSEGDVSIHKKLWTFLTT